MYHLRLTQRSLQVKAARAVVFVLTGLVLGVALLVPAVRAERMAPARREARSLAQQKIDGRLMYEVSRRRGDVTVRGKTRRSTGVRVDRHGRAFVDVHASVTPPLQKKISALGGRIVSTSGTHGTIVVWMPLLTIERLAGDDTVHSIAPAP
jgi:hypothetical protein